MAFTRHTAVYIQFHKSRSYPNSRLERVTYVTRDFPSQVIYITGDLSHRGAQTFRVFWCQFAGNPLPDRPERMPLVRLRKVLPATGGAYAVCRTRRTRLARLVLVAAAVGELET